MELERPRRGSFSNLVHNSGHIQSWVIQSIEGIMGTHNYTGWMEINLDLCNSRGLEAYGSCQLISIAYVYKGKSSAPVSRNLSLSCRTARGARDFHGVNGVTARERASDSRKGPISAGAHGDGCGVAVGNNSDIPEPGFAGVGDIGEPIAVTAVGRVPVVRVGEPDDQAVRVEGRNVTERRPGKVGSAGAGVTAVGAIADDFVRLEVEPDGGSVGAQSKRRSYGNGESVEFEHCMRLQR